MVSALELIERQQHVDKALWAITWYRISCQYLQVAKMRGRPLTYDDRGQVDGCNTCLLELCIAVVNCRCIHGDIPALQEQSF